MHENAPLGARRGSLTVMLLVLVLVSAPTVLLGDIFELKDGRRIEGTVIGQFGTLISIKTSGGKVLTIEASEIKRRRKTNTTYDDYVQRKARASGVDGHLELARWCLGKRLDRESIFHFKKVLVLDPNHLDAREALGYEKVRADWYPKGPEAEAAKAKADPDAMPFRDVPDDFVAAKVKKSWKKKSRSGQPRNGKSENGKPGARKLSPPPGMPSIQLTVKERISGKPPEISGMTYLLREFLTEMKQPMGLGTDGGAGDYVMKIDLKVKFVRTLMFYKRLPLYHIYKGEATVSLIERGEKGKRLVTLRTTCPFSASVSIEKDEAVMYAYHVIINTVLYRLSTHKFFKGRGAKLRKDPRE